MSSEPIFRTNLNLVYIRRATITPDTKRRRTKDTIKRSLNLSFSDGVRSNPSRPGGPGGPGGSDGPGDDMLHKSCILKLIQIRSSGYVLMCRAPLSDVLFL